MDWVAVAIEEYKTLRAESIASMQMQQSILRFGSATLGIILAAGFNVWERKILAELVFLAFAPLATYLIIIIWTGEVARMFRAGAYLREIEKKINSQFPNMQPALLWEQTLAQVQPDGRTMHQGLRAHYVSIFLLYVILALASIVIGNYKLWSTVSAVTFWSIDFVEALIFGVVLYLAVTLESRYR